MDSGQSIQTLSIGKKKGWYLSRNVAVTLLVLFMGALLGAGLVYYYGTQFVARDATPVEASSTDFASAGISGFSTHAPSTTITVSKATKKITDIRLPRSIKPMKYLLRLQPFINGNLSIMGYAEITFLVLETTSNVSIHLADIVTKNQTIKVNPTDDLTGPGVKIMQHKYDKLREFYVAMLGTELMAGKQYVLSMHFEGLLNDQLKGFYRSQYTDAAGNVKMLATTQFQPTDARRAFPCFDEPSLRAPFEVYLARQTNMSTISNMPKIDTTPIADQEGWVWDHYDTTVPMSPYMIAFVVSDLSHITSTANANVLFRVWARDEAINQAEYSKQIGPAILTWFENYFDIPFPLPKQDMVAVPDSSAGAMENWGLIIYRETSLLYDKAVSSARNKQMVAIVVSHELAHQWFGNLVTPSWWTDLWLDEGFASYLEYLGVDAVEPSWKMLEQFVINDLHSVLGLDCLESSHPISIPVNHPDEIKEIFDDISYYKGSSIVRMMNHFLGEQTLKRGLSEYLRYFAYTSAEQDDLWGFLTEQAHMDNNLPADMSVKTIMDTWTLQMGYPVITVNFKNDGTAMITQERFLLVKNQNSTDTHDYKWWVPITFATQDQPDFNDTRPSSWMSSSETSKIITGMPSKDKWTILNLQQTGYYRVNYDVNNWKMISKQLKMDHNVIHVINRAQIVDDALDLARAGRLSYDVALDVMSYLSRESDYVPWKSALNNLEYIRDLLTHTPAYGAFKKYLLSLLVPLYQSVGFEDRFGDTLLDQYKRENAIKWACNLGYEDCTKNAQDLYSRWMANPDNHSIIAPNLKSIVFRTAIREGGEKEWNFGWNQYLKSNVAAEKINMLKALSCTKQLWILSKYLGMAFHAGSEIRKQNSIMVADYVAYNEFGIDLTWNYLRDNWTNITAYYGPNVLSLGRLIEVTSLKFNTNLKLQELISFRDDNSATLVSAKRRVNQSIERTENNLAWLDTHYDVIVKWLGNNGFPV